MSESRHLCVEPTFTVGRVATHVALRKLEIFTESTKFVLAY